jgi:hypothetical protein
MKVDPITFAVIKSALDSIVDEMAYAVIRTARSEIIKDVMDYSAALCDADGLMIAQAKTIAQHLGAKAVFRCVCDTDQSRARRREAFPTKRHFTRFRDHLNRSDCTVILDPGLSRQEHRF